MLFIAVKFSLLLLLLLSLHFTWMCYSRPVFIWVFRHTNFHRLFRWTLHLNWIFEDILSYRTLHEHHMYFQPRSCVKWFCDFFVKFLVPSANKAKHFRSKKFSLHFTVPKKVLKDSQLNHFFPLFPFDSPWKHQKTSGFVMFLGGIRRK